MNKILSTTILLCPLMLTAHGLMGSNPSTYTPDYLSVPKYEKCLGKEAVQSTILWCLPKEKPKSCPIKSWEKLQTVNLVPCCQGTLLLLHPVDSITAPLHTKKYTPKLMFYQ